MDLICPVCGEPWEFDSLHEEAQERYGIPYYTNYPQNGYVPFADRKMNPEYNSDDYQKVFAEVSKEFRIKGCKALERVFGPQDSCVRNSTDEALEQRDSIYGLSRSEAAGALYDILGSDLDGAAAMLEDLGF